MQYGMSFDKEHYDGRFASREEAAEEAASLCGEHDTTRFWIGEVVPPPQPETYFDIDQVIDHANDQDEYSSEWAEDWFSPTKEQIAEVEASVKAVIGQWFDKHDLRPAFYNIGDSWRYDLINGQPVLFTNKKPEPPLTSDELIARAGVGG